MSNNELNNFLGIPEKFCNYKTSPVVVLPIPYEGTVSYGRGTKHGPEAIIEASAQVELYDEELQFETYEMGVATLPELDINDIPVGDLYGVIGPAVKKILNDDKFPLILGGEHSITPHIVRAVRDVHKRDFTVLQFDAHADLREEYEGEPFSHASAMARVREIAPAVQVGIRNLSKPEGEIIFDKKYDVFFAHEMRRSSTWIQDAISRIKTDDVYITFDVDALDSSVMPATGTPEPGGMSWYDCVDMLREVFKTKRIIGMDFVELAPIKHMHACEFLVAKLAYRSLGFLKKYSK